MMILNMWFMIFIMFLCGKYNFYFKTYTFINCFIKISIYCIKSIFNNNNLFKLYWMWNMYINNFFIIYCLWGGISIIYFSFYNSYTWEWLFKKI
uniref:NADH dehydrogenase subunit 4L n=1 Tax=Parnassius nomion TaxID=213955 RepID=A0A0U1XGS4_9NEOP|nr:NADH dehydrogenase subunit 4L [Parnassius nomion]AJR33137.1 NADH dehydrogenase subunit 4L [Parnassius nomion]